MEDEYVGLKKASDTIKRLKKEYGVTKRCRDITMVQQFIRKEFGFFIPLTKHRKKADFCILIESLIKKAYFQGRITERIEKESE